MSPSECQAANPSLRGTPYVPRKMRWKLQPTTRCPLPDLCALDYVVVPDGKAHPELSASPER